jgi:TPP-dependent pyruvate/acetoin dehydrogenase alpha subunit
MNLLHYKVLLLRSYQHVINELVKKKKILLPPHMAFGYEANAVAINNVFDSGDRIILTHRNIAYNLIFDPNLKKYINELNMKSTGVNKGLSGPMNIVNPKKGIVYTSSILGNNFSIALGFSVNNKVLKKKNITYVVTGDGAIEEGSFAETILLAKKFRSRLVFIVENNDFAMASKIKERRDNIDLELLSRAYGCNYFLLDSRNVIDYSKKLLIIKKKIKKNPSPVIVEIKTTMFNRHAGVTPGFPGDPLDIDLNKGLVIKNNVLDPAYLSSSILGELITNKIAFKIKKYLN